jgi:diketogulonate reductase-like aldo/keto reductase
LYLKAFSTYLLILYLYLYYIMDISSNVISKTILLNNGLEMPRVGLGTYAIPNIEEVVYQSIKDGVRMIDTASIYKNEKEVGNGVNKAISEGIVKREDLFIVTKCWVDDKHQPELAIKKSLAELNLSYVDLYLDHWPITTYKSEGVIRSTSTHVMWKNMENLVKNGYTKSIGVSNYNVQLLMDLLSYCEIKPVTNQVEYHPYLYQEHLNKYCMDNGIFLTAYNSLCKGVYAKTPYHEPKNLNLLEEPLIKELAGKYKTSPGVIALNWALVKDVIVIPATGNPRRMKENLEALSFKLSDEDFNKINSTLNINYRFNLVEKHDFSLFVDIFA